MWGKNSQVRVARAGGREEKAGWKLLGMNCIYCVDMKYFVLGCSLHDALVKVSLSMQSITRYHKG